MSTYIEEWRPVSGYEEFYSVSNTGKVRSLRLNIELKPSLSFKGYLRIVLWSPTGTRLTGIVHRLVAQAFIPNPENKPQINHIDCQRSNNHVSNLEWCTPKENTAHMVKLGNNRVGEQVKWSKLKEEQIIEIRNLYKSSDTSFRKLAKMYGVDQSTINSIVNRETWKHI